MADQHTTTELFAEVILPLSLPRQYTYFIPETLAESLVPGMRVLVQFGTKKFYSALILHISNQTPEGYKPKPITSIIDQYPIVNQKQLTFWRWLSAYYMCPLGDVMNAALPSGLKLESETRVILNPGAEDKFDTLDNKEYLVAEALHMRHELSLNEIREILDIKTVYPVIKSLMAKHIILLKEEMRKGYAPKTEKFISLSAKYKSTQTRKELFDSLEKAPRQLDILLHFYQLKGKRTQVPRKELLAATGNNYSAIAALIRKDILTESLEEVSRLATGSENESIKPELTDIQEQALAQIKDRFSTTDVVLLHGVTSSGKTEIYSRLIDEVIRQEKQVLYLLPEIALTGQMINRLKKIFGNNIGIYHSRFNEMERVEIWHKVLQKEYSIILGARSSLFLPFADLGLVVVDEEHDGSFKQYDPSPRYHARDAAIYLASIHKAKVILGSATPSIESYFNAQREKYGLVELFTRFGDIRLPEIKVVDTSRSKRMKTKGAYLSDTLVDDLKRVFENRKQAILFRNRRGYAPMVMCRVCAHVPQCPNCDVSLTYHKHNGQMKCHYCGYKNKLITNCSACGTAGMQVLGFGTEKVEDELSSIFEKIKISRLDYDAVRTKEGHNKVIGQFERQEVDVLVGTQMVTKGLDFDNVTLVGILMADQLWYFPDFRSYERAFQLMVQVAGRAGRKGGQGEVLIQAKDTKHLLLDLVKSHDYATFYQTELIQRRKFGYPPYRRLIILHFKHRQIDTVHNAARMVYSKLKPKLGKRVFAPNVPPVGRIRNQYILQIMIKLEKKSELVSQAKSIILEELERLALKPEYRSVRVYADVDPQ